MRATTVGVLATGLVLAPVSPAHAADAERSGWWNRASAGPLAAPAPTTAPGDLRVAGTGDAPAAYSAVLFRAPGATDATLDLAVRAGSSLGTVEVLACPTKADDWKAGDDQPYDTAPAYDCDAGSAFGSLSADGTTLSFVLDSSTQLAPGTWSLALVPQPGSTAGPFAIDLEPPGPASLTAQVAGPTTADPAVPTPPPPAEQPAAAAGSGDAALVAALLQPPPVEAGTADAPLLAGSVAAAPQDPSAPAPDVAPMTGAVAPPVAFRPVLAARDAWSAPRLLALLVLVGGSAAVGFAAGQGRSEPRLLGGRARSAVPVGGPLRETAAAPERPRGIGRFARERDAAPRRLR